MAKCATRNKLLKLILVLVNMATVVSAQSTSWPTSNYIDYNYEDIYDIFSNTTFPSRPKFWDDETCASGFLIGYPSYCEPPTEKVRLQIYFLCSTWEHGKYVFNSMIVGFGVPGCIFTLITVSKMPYNPSTVYFGILAVADLLAVIFASYENLFLGFVNNDYLNMACGMLATTFTTFSHWSLVLICLERFVAVTYPLHKAKLYTMKNTWISSGVSFLISNIPVLVDIFKAVGVVDVHTITIYTTVLYHILYVFFPGFSIIILTALTAYRIRKIGQRRQNMSSSKSSSSKMEFDLNRMMLHTATCFIFLGMPQSGTIIFERYMGSRIYEYCPLRFATYMFIYFFTVNISNFNHAVNFYIYYAGASGFRKLFHRAICCRKETAAHPTDKSRK